MNTDTPAADLTRAKCAELLRSNLATLEFTRSRIRDWGRSTCELDLSIQQTRAELDELFHTPTGDNA